MPKMKTHKGANKRFKITKKGKLKHYNAGHSHMQSGKSPKRRRSLRKPSLLSAEHAGKVGRLLVSRIAPPPPTPPQKPKTEDKKPETAKK